MSRLLERHSAQGLLRETRGVPEAPSWQNLETQLPGTPTAAIALWTPCPPSADAIIGSLACLALGLAIGLRSRSLGLVVAVGSAALLVRPVQAGEQQPSMSRWGGQPARLLRKVCHAAAMRGIALLTLAPSLTLARCVT